MRYPDESFIADMKKAAKTQGSAEEAGSKVIQEIPGAEKLKVRAYSNLPPRAESYGTLECVDPARKNACIAKVDLKKEKPIETIVEELALAVRQVLGKTS